VLDVEDIRRLSPKIGELVQLVEISGALHDVYLSRKPVREEAFRQTGQWLRSLR